MKTWRMTAMLGLAFVSGCWTVRETEHVPVQVGSMPAGKDVKVLLAGFDATVTRYDVAYGYTTMTGVGPSWYDRFGRSYGGGFRTTTYSTTEFVPRTESTPTYRNRATDALERAGCILKTTSPAYRLEVRFSGPYSESGDGWASFGWMVCTLFTAEYAGQAWRAELLIHDLKTGKLVLNREFVQRDEAVVWGPIPLFSPSGSDRTSSAVQKHLCLTALTDEAVAAATAFFAGR